jgi:hypothetical protein
MCSSRPLRQYHTPTSRAAIMLRGSTDQYGRHASVAVSNCEGEGHAARFELDLSHNCGNLVLWLFSLILLFYFLFVSFSPFMYPRFHLYFVYFFLIPLICLCLPFFLLAFVSYFLLCFSLTLFLLPLLLYLFFPIFFNYLLINSFGYCQQQIFISRLEISRCFFFISLLALSFVFCFLF